MNARGPRILREAVIVPQQGGQVRIENANHRTLLFLAVPPNFLKRIQPGEFQISAIVGEDDLSILEAVGLELKIPMNLVQLRKKPLCLRPARQSLGGLYAFYQSAASPRRTRSSGGSS